MECTVILVFVKSLSLYSMAPMHGRAPLRCWLKGNLFLWHALSFIRCNYPIFKDIIKVRLNAKVANSHETRAA